jgi:lysophospholipase L1-like esterase
MKTFSKIAAAVLVASLLAVPAFAQRGSADFSKFVAIGDSYGAGYGANSLNERHQAFSWPAVIARQVGYRLCTPQDVAGSTCFAQPLVSYPGIPGGELILLDLTGSIGQVPGSGSPLMNTFARPFNNLAVPGANVTDVNTIKGNESQTAAAAFILRGLGTQVEQAIAQHPTFIAIWIGGNDLLGAVAAGTPALMTPTATFKTQYERMLDTLIAGAPNAGMVVGNLPTNPLSLPYVNTVPPVLVNPATRQPILGPNGQPIFLVYDNNGTPAQLTPGSFVLLPALAKIRTGFGIPASLAAVPPFNQLPNVGRPLAGTDVITPDEATAMAARAAEFNQVINTAASARNIPVADINGLFNRAVTGMSIAGIGINSSFATGGFFSLDGVHLTDLGYLLFANEYIRTINNAYDTRIPVASITQLFANNGAFFGNDANASSFDPTTSTMTTQASEALRSVMNPQVPQQAPTRTRRRVAGH